jgi:hypothetical protein
VDPRSSILEWLNSNNFMEMLSTNEETFELMNKNEETIRESFLEFIDSINFMLTLFCVLFFPVVIVTIFVLRNMFLKNVK